MIRRNILQGLILPVSVAALSSKRAEAQTCTAPCFPQTPAEQAASPPVVPVSTQYPEGDVFRYMTQAQINDVTSGALAFSVSAALNTAFRVPGITVTLHAGNYRCDDNLVIGACTEVVGPGWNSTVLRANGASITNFVTLNDSLNQRLRGFKILGNSNAGAVGLLVGNTLSSNVHFQDIWIEGFSGSGAVGLWVQNVVTLLFQNCYINSNALNVKIDGTSGAPTTVQFIGGAIRQSATHGVSIMSGSSIRFSGTVIEANTNAGIYAVTAANKIIQDLLIDGNCWFEDNWRGYSSPTTRVYDVVIDGTAGLPSSNLIISDARFSHGSSASDNRRSLHVKNALASLSNMRCYYAFPYEIVIEGGPGHGTASNSYVQLIGDSADRMARFVANLDGANVIYPTYRSLIDQGNGMSTLP